MFIIHVQIWYLTLKKSWDASHFLRFVPKVFCAFLKLLHSLKLPIKYGEIEESHHGQKWKQWGKMETVGKKRFAWHFMYCGKGRSELCCGFNSGPR